MVVARAWAQYDRDVEPFRNTRDEALARGEDPETVWKRYDEETYCLRISFEKAIMDSRTVLCKEMAKYRAGISVVNLEEFLPQC